MKRFTLFISLMLVLGMAACSSYPHWKKTSEEEVVVIGERSPFGKSPLNDTVSTTVPVPSDSCDMPSDSIGEVLSAE